MIVAHVASSIATIYPDVPAVPTNLMRVRADLPAIGAQFLLRCPFAFVLAIFTNVAAPLSNVPANVATIGTDVSCVRSNLSSIGPQFLAFCRFKSATI